MIVLAHAGHWYVQILYAAPLIIMVVMLAVGRVRHGRQGGQVDHDAGSAPPEEPLLPPTERPGERS